MPTNLRDHLALGAADPALNHLILTVVETCGEISALVRRGEMGEALGALESQNVQGEVQKKLDVISNDMLLRQCAASPGLIAMASEEMDDIYPVREVGPEGGFLLLFDPLDGSSNIDVNVSIGTIFSILPAPRAETPRASTQADFLQSGRAQVAAGYVVYGPQTTLVLTLGAGVHAFTLDPQTGEWVQTSSGVTIPRETKEYAINASNLRHWAPPVRRYIEACLAGEDGPRGKNFNMRWIASMVADVHRIMVRGGVFLYSWDARGNCSGGWPAGVARGVGI